MKWCLAGFFGIFLCISKAQVKGRFNLTLAYGISYFFNDKSLNRHLDNTQMLGINYFLGNKGQRFFFSPALRIQFVDYHSEMSHDGLVHVSQNLLGLDLDVLLKVNKFSLIRMGLMVNKTNLSSIYISQKLYGNQGSYGYGNQEIEKGYSQADWQAGVTIGASFPFRLFKREQTFNVKLVRLVSPVVNSDYVLSKTLVGEEIKVLSVKAKPTQITLGFDINLKRVKTKKEILSQD